MFYGHRPSRGGAPFGGAFSAGGEAPSGGGVLVLPDRLGTRGEPRPDLRRHYPAFLHEQAAEGDKRWMLTSERGSGVPSPPCLPPPASNQTAGGRWLRHSEGELEVDWGGVGVGGGGFWSNTR